MALLRLFDNLRTSGWTFDQLRELAVEIFKAYDDIIAHTEGNILHCQASIDKMNAYLTGCPRPDECEFVGKEIMNQTNYIAIFEMQKQKNQQKKNDSNDVINTAVELMAYTNDFSDLVEQLKEIAYRED